MLFSEFSAFLQKLESTASRLAMTEILAEVFQKLEKDEISFACYLMQGRLVPRYESLEFQLSVKMVLRALARIEGAGQDEQSPPAQTESLFAAVDESFSQSPQDATLEDITRRYKKLGDVGLMAEEIIQNFGKNSDQPLASTLNISAVYQELVVVAQEGGIGSQERKLDLLVVLLQKLDPISAKFVARVIIGKLRLGFSTMTLFDALSWAKHGDKSASKVLENAYQKKADIGKLAEVYLAKEDVVSDKKALESYSIETGVPVVPSLCQRLNSAAEIIEKMGEVLAEPKYDGLRIQIHIQKSGADLFAKAFTRNLEDVSHMFPELVVAAQQLTCKNCILDAEAIGFSPKTGQLLPFQETITRKRKHDVAKQAASVPIRFYVFDIMSLNSVSLIDEPLTERKKILETILEQKNIDIDTDLPLYPTPFITTNSPEELHAFHDNQLGEGLEGAVIKKTTSLYRSGRKGWRWVKIKEEEGQRGKLSDTLDCILMGYYFGRGKRSDFGIGAILVGVLGEDENGEQQIKTFAKVGTGLTDEQFRETKTRADAVRSEKKPPLYDVHKNLFPDVWTEPAVVVEIAADEITLSPIHTAGRALRFPRLVRFRDDKSWEDATTTEELKSISHLESKTHEKKE